MSDRRSENYLFVVLAGVVGISVVAMLCARLGAPQAFASAFLVYLMPQLCLLAFAVAIRREAGFLMGVLLGMAATTGVQAVWEMRWYEGPNSMPFFAYLFMAVPSVALGILLAHLLLKVPRLGRISTVVAFLCTTPFMWFLLCTEPAASRQWPRTEAESR